MTINLKIKHLAQSAIERGPSGIFWFLRGPKTTNIILSFKKQAQPPEQAT